MPDNKNLTQATGGAEPPVPITTDSSPSKADVFPPLVTIPPEALLTGLAHKDISAIASGTWLQASSLINLPLNATQNTVLLNVPLFNDYTNDAIRLMWLLHDRFNGIIDYRVTVFGNQVLFGALEMGITPHKIANPTVNDLRIIEGKTVPANGTILYTFSLGTIVGDDGVMRNFWNTTDSMANITSAYLVVLTNVPIMTAMDSSNTNIYIRIESKLDPMSAFALTSMSSISSAVTKLTDTSSSVTLSTSKVDGASLLNLNGTRVSQLFGKDQLYMSYDGLYDIGTSNSFDPSEVTISSTEFSHIGQEWWSAASKKNAFGTKYTCTYPYSNKFAAGNFYSKVTYTDQDIETIDTPPQTCYTVTTHTWNGKIGFVGSTLVRDFANVHQVHDSAFGYVKNANWTNKSYGFLVIPDKNNPLTVKFKKDISPATTDFADIFSNWDIRAVDVLAGDVIQSLTAVTYLGTVPSVEMFTTKSSEWTSSGFKSSYNFATIAAKVIQDEKIAYVFPFSVIVKGFDDLEYDKSGYTKDGSGPWIRNAINTTNWDSINADNNPVNTQFTNQANTVIVGVRTADYSPKYSDFSFSYGEFIISPSYELYTKVPEMTRRVVFTTTVPSTVTQALAEDGIPTIETLMPLTFPVLEKNEIISFDLVTPNNFQTILTVMWDPNYNVFYSNPKDQTLPRFAVYNTHGMGDLLLANCYKTTIGNLPKKSIATDFLTRIVAVNDKNPTIISSVKNGPTLTLLKKSMLKTKNASRKDR